MVERGHELGCHGQSHRPFADMSAAEAHEELRQSSSILREFGTVTSFRAPYLRFPEAFVPLLKEHGYHLDGSLAKYKWSYWRRRRSFGLTRVPASMSSSWLRLPAPIRDPILRRLKSPAVLVVHPWEFVDLRHAPIRWDCRAGTGTHALSAVRQVIDLVRAEGFRFRLMRDLPYESGA